MNISIKKGDLLAAFKLNEFDAITHCCNCCCVMGAGIALQIKQQYPEAFIADCKYLLTGDQRKLGTFSFAKTPHGIIYNLYGQHKYGGKGVLVEYPFIEQGLIAIEKAMVKDNKKILGMPWIGCGLAGGNKTEIRNILDKVFGNSSVDVVIYEQ